MADEKKKSWQIATIAGNKNEGIIKLIQVAVFYPILIKELYDGKKQLSDAFSFRKDDSICG